MPKVAHYKKRLQDFRDIHDIVTSMGNMALMEYNHVAAGSQYLADMAQSLLRTLACLLKHQDFNFTNTSDSRCLLIIVGSERGFCDRFNRSLIERWEEADTAGSFRSVIVVGQRLAYQIPDSAVDCVIPGPSTFDDIPETIQALTDQMLTIYQDAGTLSYVPWMVISNRIDQHRLQPSIQGPHEDILASQTGPQEPPMTYLEPVRLIESLIEQYIINWLYSVFYQSFAAENLTRYHHLSAAGDKLDKTITRLERRIKRLSESAITSEIENLLTSAKLAIKEVDS